VLDEKGMVLDINHSFAEQLDSCPAEIRNTLLADHFNQHSGEHLRKVITSLQKQGSTAMNHFSVSCNNKQEMPALLSISRAGAGTATSPNPASNGRCGKCGWGRLHNCSRFIPQTMLVIAYQLMYILIYDC
jgi:hypothetical protein